MPLIEADKVERGHDGDARPLLSGHRRRYRATLTHVRSPFSFGGGPRRVRVTLVPGPRQIRCHLALRRRWPAVIAVGQDPTESAPRRRGSNRRCCESPPPHPFLPWFSVMAPRQDGVGRGGTHRGTKRGEQPVAIRAVKRRPPCRLLYAWRKFNVAPDRTQRDQERAVHHALQMRGKRHAHICEAPLVQARHQPDQEQKHAMPHQSTIGRSHKSCPSTRAITARLRHRAFGTGPIHHNGRFGPFNFPKSGR